ncbi:hypothetical protein [Lusitaniella coriacea]|uniref:hypothetical protein n=1 Tax=Lusitaniella coriacea TaxID=1983105 RepID=UPI003CF17411
MERGLLWLPLLGLFFWLAWAGWNEYQKVEAYQGWATQFDKAKYDIYAVLGQKGSQVTWGKPSRDKPIELKTFSLNEVQEIRLLVNDRPVTGENLPRKGTTALEFCLTNAEDSIKVPFTEIALAAKWKDYLIEQWRKARSRKDPQVP